MAILRVVDAAGNQVWEAFRCDECGHIWLPLKRGDLPPSCSKGNCRSWKWNGRKYPPKPKPVKPEVEYLPWKGRGHHPLCSCVVCLAQIKPLKAPRGRPKGIAGKLTDAGREMVRGNMAKARKVLRGRGRNKAHDLPQKPTQVHANSLLETLSGTAGAGAGG